MRDPRYAKLAKQLIEYSVDLQPGEKVLIQSTDGETALTTELIKAAYAAGGHPFVNAVDLKVMREWATGVTEEQLKLMAAWDVEMMKKMDAYISIGAQRNIYEMSGVPGEKYKLMETLYSVPVHDEVRVPHTKWAILLAPTEAWAQKAEMSTEAFEEYLFSVCTVDYRKMEEAMQPLKELMDRTDNVRIIGPGTDIRFSIKDIGTVKCHGRRNLPDGEIYTAPVRDSVNGVIQYNAPTIYQNTNFDDVRLVFENGKIIEATANNTERLNEILDTDEGARYIGEFAIAFNPYIMEPMRNVLYDEKIAGSFHLTPGQCYQKAYNGNQSAIHWDLVCIQRPEYGGGEIWFDDVLIRKDGLFVLPELERLNPEKLK